ncbi:MAG: 3-oxoacyl-[acyl-carrier-protein] reductase [Thermodesulfobacteriota bacterium]
MTESSGRTILVTGGSKGIGRAICLALAGPDSRIYFNYSSDSAAAEKTEELVAAAGGRVKGIQADVASEASVRDLFDSIVKEAGGLDVLVNNAGITRDGLVLRMKEQDWDAVMDINLKGTFRCAKLAAKTMLKQRKGRIINISSVVAFSGNPGQANYVAAKSGIIGLTKALARELASRNITVNAVAPGYVETDMTGAMTDKARSALVEQIPLGRVGMPEDVAEAVAFLASEGAGYITGQVIHVNGGMYM